MKALITGATGFIGSRLVSRLERPVVLSRSPQKAKESLGDVTAFGWEPMSGPPPAEAFDGVDAVIHLAGEPVAEGRWNEAKKQRIRDSRVVGTRHLVEALAKLERRPAVLVSGSAIGFYGSRGDELLDETSQPGNDFLAHVCRDWERESHAAEALDVRVVNLRIGIVLGEGGGALEKMLTPFKLGLGGRLGDGHQWMSWVHVDDVVGLCLLAAERDTLRGPLNATSPNPLTNREFTRVLADVLNRPAVLPAPAFALRLALGEFADILLASQRVAPRVALDAGYRFQFAHLGDALRSTILAEQPVAR